MMTDKSMKQSYLKLIACAGLLILAAGCGDDQSDQVPADENAVSEPADNDSGMDSTEPAAPTEPATEDTSGTGDDKQAMEEESAAAPDSATTGDDGSAGGEAQTHTVEARATAFDPVAIRINPGDTVAWTNMSGHNVHFEEGLIPEGAEPYQSPLGNNVSQTYDKEGIYLYKCDPHFAMGMVGAIIVGEPGNLEQVEQNAKGMYKRALAKAKAGME